MWFIGSDCPPALTQQWKTVFAQSEVIKAFGNRDEWAIDTQPRDEQCRDTELSYQKRWLTFYHPHTSFFPRNKTTFYSFYLTLTNDNQSTYKKTHRTTTPIYSRVQITIDLFYRQTKKNGELNEWTIKWVKKSRIRAPVDDYAALKWRNINYIKKKSCFPQ